MGSKSRIAKYIVPIIQKCIDDNNINSYIEPFCGGCNIIDKIQCPNRLANDVNPYLIALFKYLQQGGVLPDIISKELYSQVRCDYEKEKNEYEEWVVGAIGFLASYNSKFFGGYAGTVHTKTGVVRDYYNEAKRNIEKQIEKLKDVKFYDGDYLKYWSKVQNALIYCDPPYFNTTKYKNGYFFEHIIFWDTMRSWSRDNFVLISELNAPKDFICIWEHEVIRTIDNNTRTSAVEKLFVYKHGKFADYLKNKKEKCSDDTQKVYGYRKTQRNLY